MGTKVLHVLLTVTSVLYFYGSIWYHCELHLSCLFVVLLQPLVL